MSLQKIVAAPANGRTGRIVEAAFVANHSLPSHRGGLDDTGSSRRVWPLGSGLSQSVAQGLKLLPVLGQFRPQGAALRGNRHENGASGNQHCRSQSAKASVRLLHDALGPGADGEGIHSFHKAGQYHQRPEYSRDHRIPPRNLGVIEGERLRRSRGYHEHYSLAKALTSLVAVTCIIFCAAIVCGAFQ